MVVPDISKAVKIYWNLPKFEVIVCSCNNTLLVADGILMGMTKLCVLRGCVVPRLVISVTSKQLYPLASGKVRRVCVGWYVLGTN